VRTMPGELETVKFPLPKGLRIASGDVADEFEVNQL